jgi:23S rRNA (cytidine1920-2'-O)/16S rRNA (cytidine1409-2'-O)-methyltransferase
MTDISPKSSPQSPSPAFASRAGEKLRAALDAFGLDVAGWLAADFGCNVGGFTDCLLQAGAAKVYAIDTGYGELAWKLRKDPRVAVMERTNALYCDVAEPVDLVVIDVAWTPQILSVPAARRWLKVSSARPGVIISLLKPHYEYKKLAGRPPHAVLSQSETSQTVLKVCQALTEIGCAPKAIARSPLIGKGGNNEFLLLFEIPGPAE